MSIFLFLASLFFTSLLLAQAEPVETEAQIQQTIRPGFSTRDFRPWMDANLKPWLDGNDATGDWSGCREKCMGKGVDLGLSSMNEVWGNTTGGIKTGSVATGALQLATAIDFEKLIGWQGGSFYSRWLFLTGQDPSANLVGDFFNISNIYGYNTFRNTELWVQQKSWDDKFSLRAGQLVADSEFAISDYGALFINSTFGWPAFIYTSVPNSGPNYPVGTPGVRLEWKPTEQLSFKTAVFQGNSQSQNINNHGFYWELNADQGFFYMGETIYHYDLGLPGQIKAGSWFYSADFPNANGSNSLFWGNYGIYGIVDQMIYRKLTPISKVVKSPENVLPSGNGKKVVDVPINQGLGVFSRIAFEPADRNLVSFYCDSGLNYKGLLPARDHDTLGLGIAYGEFSRAAMGNTTGGQSFCSTSSGLTQIQPGSLAAGFEMAIETTYLAQLTPWLVIQPDMQYIIHPGPASNLGYSLVLGLRATVTF
ncbi:MAG: carbohydrate porin [Chthoniobacterales bacterium]